MSVLNKLKPKTGSIKKKFKKARGISSGSGKTSGRGHRGQKCRSGYSKRAGFEGGQTPLFRRLPKRQTNTRLNRKEFTILNLSDLEAMAANGIKEIDAIVLMEQGLIKDLKPYGIKVLARGELKSAITVTADRFSEKAKEAIEKAGGKAVLN